MEANDNKRLGDKPQGRIGAHEEEKRLAAHEVGLISEQSASSAVAAGAAGAGMNAAAADAPATGSRSSGSLIAKVLGAICLVALIGLVSIFIYKGTVGEAEDPHYVARSASAVDNQGRAVPYRGSSVAAQAFATQRPVIVYLFNNDSEGVADRGVLNSLAKAVSGTNDIVLIDAYADPSGSAAYNQALSQKRADAMAQYLQRHGVPKSHIKAVGHGETSKYATPELCRRAEITVR